MALLHAASITPTKQEVLEAFVPAQPWCETTGADRTVTQVGSFRFDDPAGEVGLETFLVRVGDGPVLQVPLSYRGAPLAGAEAYLVTTMEHTVLGRRWVYDACGDPAYAAALATTILTGGVQAEQHVLRDGVQTRREPTTYVAGSGAPGSVVPPGGALAVDSQGPVTTLTWGDLRLAVVRVVGTAAPGGPDAPATLTGTWPGHDEPAVLAYLA